MISTPSLTATSATERSPLMEQLGRRIDTDRDGQVTSAEFSSFLTGLMKSLDDEQAPATPARNALSAANAPALTAQASPMTPAQASALLRQTFEPVTRSR